MIKRELHPHIDQAYAWLCQQRQAYSPNSNVWNLRRHWEEDKPRLQHLLLTDSYCFSSQLEIRFPDERLEILTARDSLVLKAMALVLGDELAPLISPACSHVAGDGGAQGGGAVGTGQFMF
ncbi:MAG: hypothetical protein ACL93V_11270 [Candidatus Electrothrix sp. YB6]